MTEYNKSEGIIRFLYSFFTGQDQLLMALAAGCVRIQAAGMVNSAAFTRQIRMIISKPAALYYCTFALRKSLILLNESWRLVPVQPCPSRG